MSNVAKEHQTDVATGIVWTIVTVLGFVLVLGFALRPQRHEASAMLSISQRTDTSDGSSVNFGTFKRQQVMLVKSPKVLGAALARPETASLAKVRAQDDRIGWLASQLVIDYPGDATFLRVSLRGTDRRQLATIVNAVVSEYLAELGRTQADDRRRVQLLRSAEPRS